MNPEMFEPFRPQVEGGGTNSAAAEYESYVNRLISIADAIESNLSREEDGALRSRPWLTEVRSYMSTIAQVGSTVLPFVQEYPHLSASASYTTMMIGGVAVSVLSLGVLAYRLLGAGVRSSVVEARVLVTRTFNYLIERLPRLHRRLQHLDEIVLRIKTLAEDGDTNGLKQLLGEFRETVRLCQLDIDDCIAKLEELGPAMDKCIRQLKCTLVVTSSICGIFAAAGVGSIASPGFEWNRWTVVGACGVSSFFLGKVALDCVTLKKYFVEHKTVFDSINKELGRDRIRLNSHVEALQ